MDIYDVAVEQRLEQLYGDIEMLEYHLSVCKNKRAEKGLEKLVKVVHETIVELETKK